MYLDILASANSADPDQMPQNKPSDQGLYCLPLSQQFYIHSQVLNVLVEEKYQVKWPKSIKISHENEILSQKGVQVNPPPPSPSGPSLNLLLYVYHHSNNIQTGMPKQRV